MVRLKLRRVVRPRREMTTHGRHRRCIDCGLRFDDGWAYHGYCCENYRLREANASERTHRETVPTEETDRVNGSGTRRVRRSSPTAKPEGARSSAGFRRIDRLDRVGIETRVCDGRSTISLAYSKTYTYHRTVSPKVRFFLDEWSADSRHPTIRVKASMSRLRASRETTRGRQSAENCGIQNAYLRNICLYIEYT